MTGTPSPALPDEDAFERWSTYAAADGLGLAPLPRRGRAFPAPPREGRTEHWRTAGLDPALPHLRAAVEAPATDPALAALRSYLDGEPDTLGAAAAFEIVRQVDPRGFNWYRNDSYRQLEAWCGEHGLEFAVCATLDQYAIRVVDADSGDHFSKHVPNSLPVAALARATKSE